MFYLIFFLVVVEFVVCWSVGCVLFDEGNEEKSWFKFCFVFFGVGIVVYVDVFCFWCVCIV